VNAVSARIPIAVVQLKGLAKELRGFVPAGNEARTIIHQQVALFEAAHNDLSEKVERKGQQLVGLEVERPLSASSKGLYSKTALAFCFFPIPLAGCDMA